MFSVSTGQTGILVEAEEEGKYSLIVNISLEEAYDLSKELVRSAVMFEMRNPVVVEAKKEYTEPVWEEIKVSVPEAEAVKNALDKVKKKISTDERGVVVIDETPDEEDEEDPFKEDEEDEEEEGIEIPAPKPKAEPVSVPVKNGKDKKKKR